MSRIRTPKIFGSPSHPPNPWHNPPTLPEKEGLNTRVNVNVSHANADRHPTDGVYGWREEGEVYVKAENLYTNPRSHWTQKKSQCHTSGEWCYISSSQMSDPYFILLLNHLMTISRKHWAKLVTECYVNPSTKQFLTRELRIDVEYAITVLKEQASNWCAVYKQLLLHDDLLPTTGIYA